ncbi:MAG: lactate racemase domain-containing protein [Archaeoglobaceae archaeon]
MIENIRYWDEFLPVELPERTKVVDIPFLPRLPSIKDPEDAIRNALASPIDMKTIPELVRPNKKVTIAFDDPCIGGEKLEFRETMLRLVLEELKKAGVSKGDIKLICANGLHRKWTKREISLTIGRPIVEEFGFRLLCHDAEDKENLVYLGETKSGYEVEVNRLVVDSDLFIYVNFMSNLFNGGWKSINVGLSTYRSIRYHHGPGQPLPPLELMIDQTRNPLHSALNEMGEKLEEVLGKQIFKVETVCNNKSEIAAVFTGTVASTREKALEAQIGQVLTDLSGLEQSDVLIYGLPRRMPYAIFAETNPILDIIGMGLGYLLLPSELMLKKGGVVIMVSPCLNVWDEIHHPSYIEAWNRVLTQTHDPYEMRDLFEEDFAHRPEYIYKYRFCYAYHPVHSLIILYNYYRTNYVGKVFVAGAKDPQVVKHMGFEPTKSVEEAINKAEELVGKDCSITYMRYEFPGV